MLLLLIENSRYIPYLNESEDGMLFKQEHVKTRYGSVKIWTNSDKTIAITVVLASESKNVAEIPMAIAEVIVALKVKALGLLCKVGGINSLLRVKDVLIVDDYIDVSKAYSRTCGLNTGYQNELSMSAPFCAVWRKAQIELLRQWRYRNNINIFDRGTFICTQSPFFESHAEIISYRHMMADIVGHSLSPYVYYAKELSVPYSVLSIVSNVYFREDNDEFINNEENNTLIASLARVMIDTCPHISNIII